MNSPVPALKILVVDPAGVWAHDDFPLGRPALSQRGTRELKQQQRRRPWKRQLKSEVAQLQIFSRLFHLVQFVKYWQFVLDLNSKRLIEGTENEREVVVLCSRPPQNVKLGSFTSKSCNDGKEMYKKAWCTCKIIVLTIETFCFFAVLVTSPSSLSSLVLASTTATAGKTSLLKWISVFSNFVAFILICWKCLM